LIDLFLLLVIEWMPKGDPAADSISPGFGRWRREHDSLKFGFSTGFTGNGAPERSHDADQKARRELAGRYPDGGRDQAQAQLPE
jgi:hypothetical protein